MRTLPKPVSPHAKDLMIHYQKEKAKKYGIEYVEPTQPKWFVSYPIMIVIMAVLQMMTLLYGIKMFLLFGFDVSVGWALLMPIMFFLFQIVAECYGWQYARQMMWLNFLVNMMITILMFSFKMIPFTGINKPDVQYGYTALLDNNLVYFAPTMWLGMFVSDFVTSSLMCLSRFQCNGKFIIARVAILHCLAEAIMLSGGFIAGPLTGVPVPTIWKYSIDSFIARSIIMIILLPFARFIIWYIQHKIEGVVVFDYKATFNPFKFSINPSDYIQFSADGWDKLSVGKIDVKKMAQAYSDDFFEEQERNIQTGLAKQHKKYGIDKEETTSDSNKTF